MINGGLDRLDPHSTFINAKDFKQFSKASEGQFGGIGIQLGYDRNSGMQLAVISPMVGTPAYEAGILANDLIVKIDGKSTENMRLNEAVDLIQGEPGQKVMLTVVHEGSKEPVDVPIVRAKIEVQSVLGDLRKPDNPKEWDFFVDKPNKIAYLRLTNFSKTSTDEMKKVLAQLHKEGMKGLVLDLRGNPGGLLKAAVEISNLFLSEGRIVATRGRNEKEEAYDADASKSLLSPEECAVAILVNRYSASASEILSAALQDHNRAVIVGERTYGKGSVQNVLPMENNTSALKLTTASYWRPSGKNIHRFPDKKEFEAAQIDPDEWGVKPNDGFEVVLKDEERIGYAVYRRDRDVVQGKGADPKTSDKEKKPFEDRVLQKALEHLREQVKKVGKVKGPGPAADA
jgi:carboxyl-terminal processing protease